MEGDEAGAAKEGTDGVLSEDRARTAADLTTSLIKV